MAHLKYRQFIGNIYQKITIEHNVLNSFIEQIAQNGAIDGGASPTKRENNALQMFVLRWF